MDHPTVPQTASALSTLPQPDTRSGRARRSAVGYVRVGTGPVGAFAAAKRTLCAENARCLGASGLGSPLTPCGTRLAASLRAFGFIDVYCPLSRRQERDAGGTMEHARARVESSRGRSARIGMAAMAALALRRQRDLGGGNSHRACRRCQRCQGSPPKELSVWGVGRF